MADNRVDLFPGTTRVPGDIKTFKGIRVTTERFGMGQKIGSIRLPDFKNSTYMNTKTEPAMSDEEFKKAIIELAKKDAEKGQFHNETKEYFELMKGYVSSVSPDRESVVTSSIKQIFGKTNSKEPVIDEKKNILYQTLKLMNKIKNKSKTNNDTINSLNNAMFGKVNMTGDKLEYVEFYGNNGKIIATYSDTLGWDCPSTAEENARRQEFCDIYNTAWNSTRAEIEGQSRGISMPKHLEGGTTIDVVG